MTLSTQDGNPSPSALARSARARWESWLQPVGADASVGSDAMYEDDFQAIRDEVAKLSDVNDTLIIDNAERLLKQHAKDARVAVYYAYGRLRRDGAEGLADGLELCAWLIECFGESLLPARIESRKAAIEWLASSTFTGRLDQLQALNGEWLERAMSALALITESTAQWPDQARPALDGLSRRLCDRREAQQRASSGNLESAARIAASEPSVPITSSRELLERARQMASFLRERPDGYLAAWRLLRCIRWDTLTAPPPHGASGKTKLPGPRPELRANIKRLLLQKQWPSLLEGIEAAFAESANHYWLDLQYYAYIAQEQAGGDYAAVRDYALTDCSLLLKRLPGIEHLLFDDGSPFAESATLEWIARHITAAVEQEDHSCVQAAGDDAADWLETEAQAFDLAAQQGLDNAFAWLHNLAGGDGERQRFMRLFLMARLAERCGRADIAVHLLTTLDATAQRHQLAAWEPALAFDVKQHLVRALKTRMNRKDVDKAALAQRIDNLYGELAAIDPARAVTLS